MNTQIEAVIADLDGTILDTELMNAELVRDSLTELGYKMPVNFMEWFFENCAGVGWSKSSVKLINTFNINKADLDSFSKVFDRKRKEYVETNEIAKKKGLFRLLDFLKAKGIKIAICTSSRKQEIQLFKLHHAGVSADYFETIVTGDMVKEIKPHRELYLLTCEKLGVKPENAIALEDSDLGVEAAFNAGVRVILIPDHMKNSDRAKQMAWKIVDSLDEVPSIIASQEIELSNL